MILWTLDASFPRLDALAPPYYLDGVYIPVETGIVISFQVDFADVLGSSFLFADTKSESVEFGDNVLVGELAFYDQQVSRIANFTDTMHANVIMND